MQNNKIKAAFSMGKLSTYGLTKPIKQYEHITHFTLKYILVLVVILFTQGSLSAQCGSFPDSQDGTLCTTAEFICGNQLNGITGILPDPGQVVPDFPNTCDGVGTIENAVWYAFIPCESTVEIQICPSNCQQGMTFIGIQAAIYTDCSNSFSSVVCQSTGETTCFTLNSDDFLPGFTYYLMLDGYGGSVCNYEINVLQGLQQDDFELSIDGDNEISTTPSVTCAEPDQLYSFSVPDCNVSSSGCSIPGLSAFNLMCYDWTISPNTYTVNGVTDEQLLEVEFHAEGTYTISVERSLHPYVESCSSGACDDPLSIMVDIAFIDTINNGTTVICPGEIATICGNPVGLPGVYECLDEVNCVLSIDTLEFGTSQVEDLGNIFLCPDECFSLEGIDYCDRIEYTIESANNCAITYHFAIKDVTTTIQEPAVYPLLDCNTDSVFVSMNIFTDYNGTLSYTYLNENGTVISTMNFVKIGEPGDYTFYTFSLENLPNCIDSINFTIEEETEGPEISLDAETITCSDQEALLTVNPIDNVVSFTWNGPEVSNPTTDAAFAGSTGTYYVNAEGDNGCITLDSIEVEEELLPADIGVIWEDLDCSLAQTTMRFISDVVIDSVIWNGPSDFTSKLMEAETDRIGLYTLILYAQNGCDYSEVFEILGNFQEPEFTSILPEEWACNTQTLPIEVGYGDTSNYSFVWFTNEGIIESTNSTNDNIIVGSTGEYFVEITDMVTGCTVIDTVEVLANDEIPTDVVLEAVSPLCFDVNDGSIMIGDITGGSAPFDYYLNDQVVSDLVIENLAPDEYELAIIDNNGCELKRIITITQPLEIIADIVGPAEANFNDIVVFSSDVDEVTFNIDVINWYNALGEFLGNGNDISFTMTQNEFITMEVIDENGCSVIKTRAVVLDESYDYFMPNIFTPNNDGINDFFSIFPQDLPGVILEFDVYDRWGNKIFTAKDINNETAKDPSWGWNGQFNNSAVKPGVYVYYARVVTLGVEKELKGSVTLVR